MTRYAMAIDTKRCFGCETCAVACKMSNNLPADVWYNVVHTDGGDHKDSAAGVFPEVTMRYLPVACQHCSNPACVAACPTGASAVDPETGIVGVDAELCIGCDSCIAACPYEGVRTHIGDDAAYPSEIALGDVAAPAHVGSTVEKCNFCKPRVDRGEVPACMQLCPGRARYWGDIDDPDSEISQAIAGREIERLLEESGTEPNVFYLV